jgi:hypothetical protein
MKTTSNRTARSSHATASARARRSARPTRAASQLETLVEQGVHRAASAVEEAVQNRIHEQAPQYLDDAVKRSHQALQSVVKWGRKNPIKAAAAATALVGASAFIYAYTARKRS